MLFTYDTELATYLKEEEINHSLKKLINQGDRKLYDLSLIRKDRYFGMVLKDSFEAEKGILSDKPFVKIKGSFSYNSETGYGVVKLKYSLSEGPFSRLIFMCSFLGLLFILAVIHADSFLKSLLMPGIIFVICFAAYGLFKAAVYFSLDDFERVLPNNPQENMKL